MLICDCTCHKHRWAACHHIVYLHYSYIEDMCLYYIYFGGISFCTCQSYIYEFKFITLLLYQLTQLLANGVHLKPTYLYVLVLLTYKYHEYAKINGYVYIACLYQQCYYYVIF